MELDHFVVVVVVVVEDKLDRTRRRRRKGWGCTLDGEVSSSSSSSRRGTEMDRFGIGIETSEDRSIRDEGRGSWYLQMGKEVSERGRRG